MEGLTRLVAESLSRHGIHRPVDYRRLQWSRWFRCESPHSLLLVPSKPGVFALAEEIVDLRTSTPTPGIARVEVKSHGGQVQSRSSVNDTLAREQMAMNGGLSSSDSPTSVSHFSDPYAMAVARSTTDTGRGSPISDITQRMLAIFRFCEADDMAFVLDRMFAPSHFMRSRLAEGQCFVRFVVISDAAQRNSICGALNQWMMTTAEKISGTGDFTSSFELAHASTDPPAQPVRLDSGPVTSVHIPFPLPSGF